MSKKDLQFGVFMAGVFGGFLISMALIFMNVTKVKFSQTYLSFFVRDCSNIKKWDPSIELSVHAIEVWSKDMKGQKTFWKDREAIVVKELIMMYNNVTTKEFSVLDIGCGAMHLEKAFLQELKEEKARFLYLPVDAFPRKDPRVMLCDLNNQEFPYVTGIKVSVIVLQGLLEYIYDKDNFFKTIKCLHPTTTILFTYNVYEKVGYNDLWVTPMDSKVLAEIAKKNGYREESVINLTQNQKIYKWHPSGRSKCT